MWKRARWWGVPILMMTLSGCAALPAHSVSASTAPRSAVYPLDSRWLLLRAKVERIRPTHRLTQLPATYLINQVTSQGILFTIFPTFGMPMHGWKNGLYMVSPKSAKILAFVPVPLAWSVSSAALGGDWMVYALQGESRRLGFRIAATNWVRKSRDLLWQVPLNQRLLSPITDLVVLGHTAYWVANLATHRGVVSRLFAANLTTRRVSVVWQEYPKETGLMCFSMTSTPTGLWLSVGDLNRTRGPSGSLWFWSIPRHQVTTRIPLWHAPLFLYGATPEGPIFSANVSDTANGPARIGSYPMYLANIRTHRLDQLTTPVNPGNLVTVDGATIAVAGMGISSELVNLRTASVSVLPVPDSEIGGGWLVEHLAHTMLWSPLP
ncbi:MAG: hypothetical protein OWU33_03785 [Firmicutes bacterium]|nr:hypothetical protein [Bacillota bacterium]